jgi:hypothetical protein
MNRDPRLERYLNSLEAALKPFPVSDRAEIITEIKSHVLDALDRDPQANLDSILAALGEPETVANRYLLERGLKPTKPPISPIVKWLVIGFLGSIALILAFTIALFTHFSPVVSVDEKENKVTLFGGAIQVDGKENGIKIDERGIHPIEGSAGVSTGQAVSVLFDVGAFEVKPAEGSNFVWSCSGLKDRTVNAETIGETLTLNLRGANGVSCELNVPKGSQFKISGDGGSLDIVEPSFNVDASVENGTISFEADDNSHYKFDVRAEHGSVDSFTSNTEADAFSIKLFVKNGDIEN